MEIQTERPLFEHPRKRIKYSSTNSHQKQDTERQHHGKLHERRSVIGERFVKDGMTEKRDQDDFTREQTRLNQIQEAEQMREWVSKEDDFVLKQSKKKAQIRVREGRAKCIDWLAVTLGVQDKTTDSIEDDTDKLDIDVVDPAGVFEGLTLTELRDLGKDINTYITLESNPSNRRYWNALGVICQDYQNSVTPPGPQGRSTQPVSDDINRLLAPKALEELNGLETQISAKMKSNEPIDVEYWEQLLRSIAVYKAKAELKQVYNSIISDRLTKLRQQQALEATIAKEKLMMLLTHSGTSLPQGVQNPPLIKFTSSSTPLINYSRRLDPEPLLRLGAGEKSHDVVDESDFLNKISLERRKVLTLGYVPSRQLQSERLFHSSVGKPLEATNSNASRPVPILNEDFSQATTALYEREVARGVQENEEIFAGEEEVSSLSKPHWANKYRPRKPRYFNRVQMGYEWNKYNQTHYDHDNPPPKVVQGYKFNIFYPDLIDKAKAPTYRIERENGRKRGQSFAPAGEEDTCLIRFISGPPYEDLAFRIVDKEWDYSAKRERGFRSSFDKGILQLHFQFKKVYYRK